MYLFDTCVLSELQKPQPHPAVTEATKHLSDDMIFISVMSIGEIVKGITLLDEGRRKKELLDWLFAIDKKYEQQMLDIDRETIQIWGEMIANGQKKGLQIPLADGLIAATAIRHGLHVMTRNNKDFLATGAMIVDPWQTH